MPFPSIYSVEYSYTGFSASLGDGSFPGTQLDADLAGLDQADQNIVAFLMQIARADGKLANNSVGPDQISPALSLGFTLRGNWLDATAYSGGDGVVYDEAFYKANFAHTSTPGTRPDLDPGTWTFLFAFSSIAITDGSIMPNHLVSGQQAAFQVKIGAADAEVTASALSAVGTALGNRVRVDAPNAFSSGQQAQARDNIGAASATDMAGALRKDILQSLTTAEIVRVLANTKQAWELINITDVNTAVPFVDLTGLSAYRDLRLKVTFAQTAAANLYLRFGAAGVVHTANNYAIQTIYGNGSSAVALENGSVTYATLTFGGSASTPANWAEGIVTISDFNSARPSRLISTSGIASGTGRTAGTYFATCTVNTQWDMIRLFPTDGNIGAGSRFILEGIRE